LCGFVDQPSDALRGVFYRKRTRSLGHLDTAGIVVEQRLKYLRQVLRRRLSIADDNRATHSSEYGRVLHLVIGWRSGKGNEQAWDTDEAEFCNRRGPGATDDDIGGHEELCQAVLVGDDAIIESELRIEIESIGLLEHVVVFSFTGHVVEREVLALRKQAGQADTRFVEPTRS
jgi:hypothetical protein